ncbi:MAG: 4-hydroxy-3-methylbut-2-enyl diphosphate reductase [Bacteroidia bacterium]|nr:MAG: 4-hydroxy-3-methylbut-2-enyl diphosphate reductase [Bacteroidia bacterium]
MVKIEIDPGAGFCFGVEEVIKTAETRLRAGEVLYGLGDMVHNATEVKRLQELGLKTINHEQLTTLPPGKVLFRAHGEPPGTYQTAKDYGVEIIDGTCPIVSRLQKKIQKAYGEMNHETDQLVIFGKADHPETIGLLGQVNGDALVVSSVEDIAAIDPSKKVCLFSQTTMDPERFEEVEKALENYLSKNAGTSGIHHFKANCTVCGQMKKRKPGLSAFAGKYEVMLFVSGKNSSNGRMLYEYCLSLNPVTYWISGAEEVKKEWFEGHASIGISGATSTSRQQLESVLEKVKELTLT